MVALRWCLTLPKQDKSLSVTNLGGVADSWCMLARQVNVQRRETERQQEMRLKSYSHYANQVGLCSKTALKSLAFQGVGIEGDPYAAKARQWREIKNCGEIAPESDT